MPLLIMAQDTRHLVAKVTRIGERPGQRLRSGRVDPITLLTKLLDLPKIVVPAAACTGLVLWIAPSSWGLLTGQGDIYWIKGGTIFSGFWMCIYFIVAYFDSIVEKISDSRVKPKQRREAIRKITSLNDKQRIYVHYLKYNELQQFQACVNDHTISALANMDILETHERTIPNYRRFTIHPEVWRELPEPPDEKTRKWIRDKFKANPPWDSSHHAERY